jgi:hypothetical protein
MAVPVKPVFASNTVVPSSQLNQLGDLANYATKPPACAVTRSTVQAITNATITYITFDTELVDTTGTMFTASSTTITVPETGIYLASGYVGMTFNATGYRRLLLDQNGSFPIIDARGAVNGDHTHMTLNTLLVCTVGDTIKLAVEQTSGGALNTVGIPRLTLSWQSAT